MKRFISIIIYVVLRKFLPFLQELELEADQERLQRIKSRLKSCGKDIKITSPFQISGEHFIEIGDNFFSNQNLRLEAVFKYGGVDSTPVLRFGNNVLMSKNCHIGAWNRIEIGDGTLLGSNVFITDHFHGSIVASELSTPPIQRKLYSKGPVIIGKNVWIGDGVCIMPNVTIGDNVIIGANSVVTKSFGPNLVVAGNPAKVIKDLNQ